MLRLNSYINGQFCGGIKVMDVVNPVLGENYAELECVAQDGVNEAVAAAKVAFPFWSALSLSERSRWLFRIADKLEEKSEEFARAESVDCGKPLSLSRSVDIPRAADNFRFFAQYLQSFSSEMRRQVNAIHMVDYQPLGVVACISPWNLPLYLLTWKLAPALAAGNTVVAKPSELTPYTAYLLSQLLDQISFPPGVLNIVHGSGAECGESLVKHPDVKAVSFTGSTTTGRHIAKSTAESFKKISLEMGGKNPTIIFADCDFEKTLNQTLRAAYSNQGQICLCGSRILVDQSIYKTFKDELAKKVAALRVGDPMDPGTDVGALISSEHLAKVEGYLQWAKQNNKSILCGGDRPDLPGYFLNPALIEDADPKSRLNQEEVFGPLATLIPFTSEEEAISIANATDYGLSASVWTQDIDRAHRVAQQMDCGMVWINCWMKRDLSTPFGGEKNSGLGREGGASAMKFFSKVKCTTVEISQESSRVEMNEKS